MRNINKDIYNKQLKFSSEVYDDLLRFVSYFYQIDLLRKLNVDSILEVGIGSKMVSNYLLSKGFKVITCDFNEKLKPDYVGDIRKLPFKNNSFECISACEILEHIPFEDFRKALFELHRVTNKYVIISLPYSSTYFECLIRFPFIESLINTHFLRIFLRIPFISNKFLSKEHYWELGRKGHSIKKIKSILNKNFKIIKTGMFAVDTYHYFFVLKKRH